MGAVGLAGGPEETRQAECSEVTGRCDTRMARPQLTCPRISARSLQT